MTMPSPASAGDEPAFPADAIEVGRVIGAFGIKGWIRVQPFSADPKALFSSRRWFIQPPERPGPKPTGAALPRLLRITQAKDQGDDVVASAQELPDRNAAEAMKGARIFISRSSFPTAGEGEYYWIDLIGLQVVNRAGELLGRVTDLLDTGAHSVLRVQKPDAAPDAPLDERERLIPFVAAYVDDVNLAERRITVDWGLDY
jgi:16S rRNA processing protein RimM